MNFIIFEFAGTRLQANDCNSKLQIYKTRPHLLPASPDIHCKAECLTVRKSGALRNGHTAYMMYPVGIGHVNQTLSGIDKMCVAIIQIGTQCVLHF